MEQLNRADYIEAVKAIKEAIQISRYRAAKLVNKEVLALYYAVVDISPSIVGMLHTEVALCGLFLINSNKKYPD